MDKPVLYLVLGAVGVFVVVEGVLLLVGKKELARKLVFPFVAILSALGLGKVLAGGTSALKAENERIKREKERIIAERDALRKELEEAASAFEEKAAALRTQIRDHDEQAMQLKRQVATMKAQGAEAWFRSLPRDKQQEIWEAVNRPGLPDDFLG